MEGDQQRTSSGWQMLVLASCQCCPPPKMDARKHLRVHSPRPCLCAWEDPGPWSCLSVGSLLPRRGWTAPKEFRFQEVPHKPRKQRKITPLLKSTDRGSVLEHQVLFCLNQDIRSLCFSRTKSLFFLSQDFMSLIFSRRKEFSLRLYLIT